MAISKLLLQKIDVRQAAGSLRIGRGLIARDAAKYGF